MSIMGPNKEKEMWLIWSKNESNLDPNMPMVLCKHVINKQSSEQTMQYHELQV